MVEQAQVASDPLELATVLSDIAPHPILADHDADRLQRAFHRQGSLDSQLACKIFDLHPTRSPDDRHWIDFFTEALASYFLHRRGDTIFIPDSEEDLLIRSIATAGPIIDPGHRRLALRLYLRATELSERYQRVVLDTVRLSLLHDEHRFLLKASRSPGVIDIVDLHLIRKLVYGAGGQYPCRISRVAAEFLLALDHQHSPLAHTEEWASFSCEAIMSHLFDGGSSTPRIDEKQADWMIANLDCRRPGTAAIHLLDHIQAEVPDIPKRLRDIAVHVRSLARRHSSDSP
ncbi:MAG: hypothetical protein ACR2Q4_00435 [Geminicoccaceae bacterium]